MDDLTISRLHRRSAFAAGLGIFLDGYDLSIIAVALILLKPQWHLDPTQTGLLGAVALAGSFLGGLMGGPLADRFGRKAIYLLDITAFFIAALASGLAWNLMSLVIFRLLLGVGVGADYPLSATYLMEFLPRKRRGRITVWVFALWMIGAIVSSLVGFVFLSLGSDAWRWMLASGALPALAVLWLRRHLPESPRWYLRRGRHQEAVRVLAALDPTLSSQECNAIVTAEEERGNQPLAKWTTLFTPPWRKRTLFTTLPWFLMDVMGYSFGVYAPMLLLALGLKSHREAVLGNVLLTSVSLIGIVMLAFTIEWWGRLKPQIWGFAGDAAGLALVGALALVGRLPIIAVFAGFVIWQISNSFGPGNTTWIFPAELYPTDLRASAHGLATAFSRLGGLIAVFFLPWVDTSIGTGGLLLSLAAAGALGALLTAWLGEETAGRPLLQEMPSVHEESVYPLRSADGAHPTI